MSFQVLPLSAIGGLTKTFELGGVNAAFTVSVTTSYNYTTGVWSIDLTDSADNVLLAGLALVPGYDLLARFPDVGVLVGGLVLIELNPDDHRSVDSLGGNTQLLWFPVGTPVVVPT